MGNNIGPHHNMIFFDGAEIVEWKEVAHVITEGEPYRGSFAKHDMDGACIDVIAGRKGSATPALEFKTDMQYVNMIASKSYSWKNIEPAKLNFALTGTATFTIKGVQHECKDFRIGQGHFGAFNNWWIGGPNCFGSSSAHGTLTCLSWDTGSYFDSCGLTFYSSKTDHFRVEWLGPMNPSQPFTQVTAVKPPANLSSLYIERDVVESNAQGSFFKVQNLAGVAIALASFLPIGYAFGRQRNKPKISDPPAVLMHL